MLLYIHVPFCRKKCSYCAFFSVPLDFGIESLSQNVPLSRYTDAVCKEISRAEKIFSHQKQRLSSIFFGGGTPSLLSSESICSILEHVGKFFEIGSDAEISIEVNPDSALRANWLKEIRAAGINRLSIGAQSFFTDDLALLGRVHSVEQIEQCVEKARQAGFANINIDLIWGLPSFEEHMMGKAIERWLFVLDRVTQLKPEHISAYSLTVEENTPLFYLFSSNSTFSPSESIEREMYGKGIALLASRGYAQYEVSNFSLPGFECSHNLGYWQGKDYFGVGPSAVSYYNQKRYTNKADIERWAKSLSLADSFEQDIEKLSADIIRKEMLMLSLRTTKGLHIDSWREQGGGDILSLCDSLITALKEEKLIQIQDKYLSLTQKGFFVSNEILSRFFEEEALF